MESTPRSEEMTMDDFFLDPSNPEDVAFWESTTPEPRTTPYAYDEEIDLPHRTK